MTADDPSDDDRPAGDPSPGSSATDDDTPPRGLELWGPRISVAIALILALVYAFVPDGGPGDFCLDDAWIHLAYAKSLRLGDGLSYNPGDWETGFSSPLWVALLAAWPTEPEPVVPVKLLGALLHAGTAGLTSLVALELARARASVERPVPALSIALLAGILAATAPTLLVGATSGMEIGLTSCLLLAAVLASLREQWLLAGVAGFAAQLARPEALFFLLAFTAVLALARRRPIAVAAGLGALAGMGAWVLYCLAVSGHPWPNTAYVKADLGDASLAGGLDYLSAQVFPWQPWIVGLGGGLALIAAAVFSDLTGRGVLERDGASATPAAGEGPRRWEVVALLVGWAAAMVATAASRALDPAVLFYQARYFAIFAAVPLIAIAVGMARTHRLLCVALILPVAVFTGLQIRDARSLQRDQERGVSLLHSDPAARVAQLERGDERSGPLVVAVEGAGATRYRAPRDTEIIDVIGLNSAAIAHADGDAAKACVLVRRAPDYFVLPDHIAAPLSKVFGFRAIDTFVDQDYAQVEERHALRVILLEVESIDPRWVERCR